MVNKAFWSVGAQDHRPVVDAFDIAEIVTGEDSETSFPEFEATDQSAGWRHVDTLEPDGFVHQVVRLAPIVRPVAHGVGLADHPRTLCKKGITSSTAQKCL